jgi:cytochrome P450
MLGIIVWTLVYFLVALIIVALAKEAICYSNLLFYKKQGVKMIYLPFLGFLTLFRGEKGQRDQLTLIKKLFKDAYEEKYEMLTCNTNKNLENVVLIMDPTLMKEFTMKELDVSIKVPILKHVNFGFFYDNGKKALHNRAVFGRFFTNDNLNKMAPKINEIVDTHFQELLEKNWGPDASRCQEEWIEIDWKMEFTKVMDKIVSVILFDEPVCPRYNETSLPQAITDHINSLMSVATNPLNVLTFDFFHNFKISSSTRRLIKEGEDLEDAIYEFFLKRKEEGLKGTMNMMDLMIKQSQMEKLTKKEIAGNTILLQFAGADTSKEISSYFMHFLSNNLDLQSKIYQALQKDIHHLSYEQLDYQGYDNSDYFNRCVKEALRMFVPFKAGNPKMAIKNFTLGKGKYKIKKGTRICMVLGSMHDNPDYHKDALKFDDERFSQENWKKMDKTKYIPFSQGKRNCVGMKMGELMIKVLMSHTLKYFEIKKSPNFEPEFKQKLTYGIDKCLALYRPRTRC